MKNHEWRNNEALKYVCSAGSFWDKYQRLKKSCEIGVLGHLFEAIEDEEYFRDYVIKRYPKTDVSALKICGGELKKLAPRRNNAAHGGNYLMHADVCTDRTNVYDKSVGQLRGQIMKLLEALFD